MPTRRTTRSKTPSRKPLTSSKSATRGRTPGRTKTSARQTPKPQRRTRRRDLGALYTQLLEHLRSTAALEQIQGLLHWDQETMMPPCGATARAEELAALEAALHQRRSDPRLEECLDELSSHPAAATDDDAFVGLSANVREARRQLERAKKLPTRLVTQLARVTSLGQQIWAEARQNNSFAHFAPQLSRIITLKREEAACLRPSNKADLYDSLLDHFEPGAQSAPLAAMFARLGPQLQQLLAHLQQEKSAQALPGPTTEMAAAAQLTLAHNVAVALGYDFTAGRLDLSVHPFTSGSVPGDVRITTRVDPRNFHNCLYSTIHEVGHALYEQGIDPRWQLQPVGETVSLGIHESQSRLWENQVGRSRAFCEWLWPQVRAAAPALSLKDAEQLYRSVNRVAPSFIRTEADEVTYNLHIILRFELERALITRQLEVTDLETAWNERMLHYFGLRVEQPSQGVLQDVHWAAGLFGYFPTYTLGNLYAAELFAAARRTTPDLDAQIAGGNFAPLLAWLREHVHQHGKIYLAHELLQRAIGHAPTEGPFVEYLKQKFLTP